MRPRGIAAALAAGALASSSAVAAPPVCELAGADRARTGSRACLGCHDGTVGADVLLRGVPTHAVGGAGHPVDVDYLRARARPGWRLAARPPAGLVLVDGRVTCTTCHDGASALPRRLAVPARDLCFGCHQL